MGVTASSVCLAAGLGFSIIDATGPVASLLLHVGVLVLLGFLPQDILRRYVEKRVQSGLGAGSHIGHMHTVPGRLSTEVEDVLIQGPTYRLAIPKGRIVLTPGFLFGKGLSFVSIDLDSPRLEITPGSQTSDSAAVNQPVLIHKLTVTLCPLTLPSQRKDARF